MRNYVLWSTSISELDYQQKSPHKLNGKTTATLPQLREMVKVQDNVTESEMYVCLNLLYAHWLG